MATDPAIALIGDLLAATAAAHSPRALVRAIAATLSARMPLTRVELGPPAPPVIAERVGGEWRVVESSTGAAAHSIAPGLAVVARGPLPAFCSDAGFRAALGQAIAAAAAHLDVIQRVATLSRRAHGENRVLREDLDRLGDGGTVVARSAAMRAVVARATLVARHATTVLVTGESGTGKEVIAREIHRRSPRAHRPMVQINCGAIPAALVESELFGHERGAFTGAERAHAGVFERAHRSTLVLDEVGELPLAAQTKLLRVLQERRFRRVGGEAELEVDVRVIAATNRSLRALVATGAFREDLLYRLDVFAVVMPPLRDRAADLGPLAATLVDELAEQLAIPPPRISRAILSRLEAYDWPGNVRELRNVLETAMILGGDRSLVLADDFPPRSGQRSAGPGFDRAVRAALEEALTATRGKIYGRDGAAARLGLKPGTLQSKLRKLGIARATFV